MWKKEFVGIQTTIAIALALLGIGGVSGYIAGEHSGRASQALSDGRVQQRLASASFKSDLFREQIFDAVSRLAHAQRVQSKQIMGSYKVELRPYPEDEKADVCVVLLPTDLDVGGDATFCYRANSKAPKYQRLGE